MSGALRLTLPMPPHVTNRARGSSHWRRGHNEKLAYWATLDALQAAGKIPAPPSTAMPRATMYLGGAMDEDNAVARHKAAIDWLRTRGYLSTDRRTGLHWEAFPEQIVKRDGNYRLELTLTPTMP